jgi:hypothetical protein
MNSGWQLVGMINHTTVRPKTLPAQLMSSIASRGDGATVQSHCVSGWGPVRSRASCKLHCADHQHTEQHVSHQHSVGEC